jgi:hypothetical protein
MQAWRCHAKVKGSTDEWEQVGCGEATLLAEDSGRVSDEWDIDAGVLPAATFEGNAVLSAAADAEVRGAGTEGRAARRAREGKLCLGQRGVGVWQRFATKWATSPQIVDSMQLFRGDSFCESSR